MLIPVLMTISCTLEIFIKQHSCLHLIDLSEDYGSEETTDTEYSVEDTTIRMENEIIKDVRRYWLVNDGSGFQSRGSLKLGRKGGGYEDEKDDNLKTKISTLVQQTLHDTENKMKSISYLKEKYREQAPYRAGFILSMVKKSRDVLNELFNVAVKHRNDWKALEQMKLFEMIVHTNVDTTNLVRQLVEIHIQHLNTTAGEYGGAGSKSVRKRVILL